MPAGVQAQTMEALLVEPGRRSCEGPWTRRWREARHHAGAGSMDGTTRPARSLGRAGSFPGQDQRSPRLRRLLAAATPASPVPRSAMLTGSGTVVSTAEKLAVKAASASSRGEPYVV